MNEGETYYYGHHHIVISQPNDADEVVIVNFTGWAANKDQSCIVEVGEHPCITKKSVVLYRAAQVLDPDAQAAFVRASTKGANVSQELLTRIQEGTQSDFIPQKCERIVAESCRRKRATQRAAAVQNHPPPVAPAPQPPVTPDD